MHFDLNERNRMTLSTVSEFKASETRTGHMMEAKRPTPGNAYRATRADPNKAALRQSRAKIAKAINTLRLSKIFSSPMPMKHPVVSNPQNQETAVAPVVCGS